MSDGIVLPPPGPAPQDPWEGARGTAEGSPSWAGGPAADGSTGVPPAAAAYAPSGGRWAAKAERTLGTPVAWAVVLQPLRSTRRSALLGVFGILGRLIGSLVGELLRRRTGSLRRTLLLAPVPGGLALLSPRLLGSPRRLETWPAGTFRVTPDGAPGRVVLALPDGRSVRAQATRDSVAALPALAEVGINGGYVDPAAVGFRPGPAAFRAATSARGRLVALGVIAVLVVAAAVAGRSSVNVTNLAVGGCYNGFGSGSGTVSTLTSTACTSAHDSQVLALVPVTADSYPGHDVLQADAEQQCPAQTRTLVDAATAQALHLSLAFLLPSQRSWDEGGQGRDITCIAIPSSGTLHQDVRSGH